VARIDEAIRVLSDVAPSVIISKTILIAEQARLWPPSYGKIPNPLEWEKVEVSNAGRGKSLAAVMSYLMSRYRIS